jgi:hypothetical protein
MLERMQMPLVAWQGWASLLDVPPTACDSIRQAFTADNGFWLNLRENRPAEALGSFAGDSFVARLWSRSAVVVCTVVVLGSAWRPFSAGA